MILGDSDYDTVFFKQMAGAMEFDAVIANPLFLHLPRGRRVFTQSIRTKEIIFVTFRLRRMTRFISGI